MSTVGKRGNRTQRKTGKKSLKVRRLHLARKKYQEELQKKKKLARDVAGLLSDIVNNIAIQQTPSTAHPDSEQNYTLHSIGSPSDCSAYRSVATQTYFEEIDELPKLRPREAKINGRRIIDFQYFFNELKDVSNHSKSLCNLNNMVITKEEKSGICTSYNLKCLVCNFEKNISSESPYRDTNLNADFVSGILSIECDFMDACILLAQIHLPLLNNDEFIQESKNACLTMDKITQRTLLETYQDASSNLEKQLQRESLARKLVAMKRRFCAHENKQREHQLTTTTQQCSSVSDNSNIQRGSQLTTMKQSSSAHDNIQKKFQLTTLKQNSSAHKNIQRELRLATMKQSSSAHENMQREHQLTTTTQQSSSVSDNSNIQRESQLTAMKQSSSAHENTQRKLQLTTLKQNFSLHKLILRKIAIKKQNSSAHENMQREHQLTTTTQQSSSVSDNSNIQKESQLTTMKQSSSEHENIQKKFQLTTLKQSSSAHKNIQREPQLATMKQSSSAHENMQREHQLTTTTQQSSSVSDNSNIQKESQLTTMKQSSSEHENIQKKFQLTTLKQSSSAHKNIQREPQLATMKQSSSAHENMQREHQLTTTTQQSSSVSDNSNIQRESQLTAMKQSSSAHENTQRKLQLTTLKQNFSVYEHIQRKLAIKKQNSSAHENMQREHQLTTTTQQSSSVSDNSNIQRESQLTAIKQSSSTHENTQRKLHLITLKQDFSAHKHIQREHKLIATQQCSSTSDNSNLFEQVHSGGLSVEDEFEIKEENVAEEENEFETMMPDQTTKTSNSKLIAGREQIILNTMTVKQEIDSDDENSNKSITKERTNKKSVMVFVNAEQIGAMLTQANEGRVCENTMVVNEEIIHSQKNASNSKLIAGREQVILNTITVTKQEIDSDDENFDKPITKETTKEKGVFVFVNAEQIGAMLTQANEGRACENENTMVVNEEKIHLQKNVMVDNNMLVKPEFHDVEMTNKERVTDFDNKPDSESPFKKARTVTYKESNNSDTQGTPTIAPNKEITVFQNRFESNRLATSATNNLRNGTATSSVTNVRTVTISVTKAGGEKITFSIPVKFNENGAPIIPQNLRDKASGTYQGKRN